MTAFLQMKGVFVAVEAGLEVKSEDIYDTLREFFTEHCGNAVEFFNDADVNTTLNDSAIATVIGIPL